MKKSLMEAIKDAEYYSNLYMDKAYIVLDMPRIKSSCHTKDFYDSNRFMFVNHSVYGIYINGKKI